MNLDYFYLLTFSFNLLSHHIQDDDDFDSFQFGREIVLLAEKKFPDFYVRRVDWAHGSHMHKHFQAGRLPAVLALDIVGNRIDW